METLRTLPGDDVRQIMWRFTDRFEMQMVVQSARQIARTVVARLVADGVRNSHEWNERKEELLTAFDQSGLTAAFMDPSQGGFIEGPKNLVLSLIAFELAWVDAGAATCSLASNLALAPIHERGTPEQRDYYMSKCVPPQPGEDRNVWRGGFALTEALPYVGVDTGVISGRVRVAEWQEGEEPLLQVEKRGRFITGMDFAHFVTAAVETGDDRIKSSCMVILEETDPGIFDRGAPTLKMVHQLSSTRDPVLNLTIPASRIIGGYTVQDGVIVPNYTHGEIIAAVFHRTRIPVGIMTSAKLLSAVEPVIRYHRQRFRGGSASNPDTPRFDLGIQMNQDAVHRLVDVWSCGEAGASLGFEAARRADEFDPIEKEKDRIFEEQGIKGARKQFLTLKKKFDDAKEYIELFHTPEGERDEARLQELAGDVLVRYVVLDALSGVLNPACKLWNTGVGTTMMREAVSLVGGYGITEDCPGFLFHKWTDGQLEATYEGPEAVQRRHLTATMTSEIFLTILRKWIEELERTGRERPGLGACTLAKAMELWLWTLEHLQAAKDPDGKPLYHAKRQGVTFPMADGLSWLLSAKYLIADVLELAAKGPENPVVAEGLEGLLTFYTDMAHVHAARAAGESARICAELVNGYLAVPQGCCGGDCTLTPAFEGANTFMRLRNQVDGSLVGSRLSKDRAGQALTQVMIPEALDYPL
ncbi:MAG: acyl-CoA dehydrogenase family protein [Desulfovibrionales bacterium]